MMALAITNSKPAAPRATMLPMESIVSSATPQNIGMLFHKDASLANLDTHGITLLTSALAVSCQEKSSEPIVFAQLQSQFGMKPPKHAHVLQTASVTTVFLAHHPDNGTIKTTLVSVLHQQRNGMVTTAHAQLEDMDQAALNVHRQDTGTAKQINVSAMRHSFGTVKTVFVLHLTSCIKEDVRTALTVTNGRTKKTDARNVNVASKSLQF